MCVCVPGMDQQHSDGSVRYCSAHAITSLVCERDTQNVFKKRFAAVLIPFCSFLQVFSSL